MSLRVYVNDSEDSEEEDDIKRKLVNNPSPIPDEQTRHYATMEDIVREGDSINEGGGNLALYEVRL